MIPIDFTQPLAAMPVNMFLHPTANKGKPGMIGLPGYVIKDSEGTGTVRGCVAGLDYNYFVINDDLYQSSGAPTSITVSETGWFTTTGTSYVSMAVGKDHVVAVSENANELVWKKISDNSDGKVDLAAALSGMNDPTMVVHMDGYFIVCSRAGAAGGYQENFYISALNNPSSWSSLDFEDADYRADNIVGLAVFNDTLRVFGKSSCEPYQNTGNADFPFERMRGASCSVGCLAPYSIKECNNVLYFLSSEKTVMGMSGFDPVKVSSPELDNLLKASTTLTDAIAWTFVAHGMWFYALKLPTDGYTYVLNTATGLWSKFMSGTTGTTNHPAVCSLVYNGDTYIGLSSGGSVAQLSASLFSEDTTGAMYGEIQTPVLDAEREPMFMGSFEVWAKKYVGSTTVNPTLSVSWSDDMAVTWSTARTLYLGLSGGTGAQLKTHRLGSSYNRIFKLSKSNIYELQLYGGYLE
jgi:hypothetical protein